MSKIGLDIDGVLCDWNTAFIQLVLEYADEDLFQPKPYVPDTWYYAQKVGYDNKVLNPVWNNIKESGVFWENLKAYPDFAEVGTKLLELAPDHDIYFITTRPSTGKVSAKHQTENWLRNWMELDTPTVIITEHKGTVGAALELDYYIDDKWENCLASAGQNPKGKTYLLDRPWNQGVGMNRADIKRVTSVLQMLEEV